MAPFSSREFRARLPTGDEAMNDGSDDSNGPAIDGGGTTANVPYTPSTDPPPDPPCDTVMLPTFPVEVPACVPSGTDVPDAQPDDGSEGGSDEDSSSEAG